MPPFDTASAAERAHVLAHRHGVAPRPLRVPVALACGGGTSPLGRLERAVSDAAMECSGYSEAGDDAAWALYQLRDALILLRRIAPTLDAGLGAADAETDMVGSDDVARVLRRWALDAAANVGVALPGGERG